MRALAKRLGMTVVVLLSGLILRAEMKHGAPGWFYIAPVAAIVSGLLYIRSARRRP